MDRGSSLLVVAACLALAVSLAGCMDRAPDPGGENVSDDETALESDSTREQFEGAADDGGGDGSVVEDLASVAPGTVLGGLVGVVALGSRRRV
jgi:hypothetical protein